MLRAFKNVLVVKLLYFYERSCSKYEITSFYLMETKSFTVLIIFKWIIKEKNVLKPTYFKSLINKPLFFLVNCNHSGSVVTGGSRFNTR